MTYANKGVLVRLIYLSISLINWLLRLGGRYFGSRRLILCYHGITNFEADAFRRQMQSIIGRVLALDTAKPNDQVQFSRPSVVLTFDDAFENLLTNVIPIINELRFPISIFVVTGCMGNKPAWPEDRGYHHDEHELLMDSEQTKQLSGNPLISIGTHTHTHPRLADIDSHAVEAELRDSKKMLESLINREVINLAFPHGSYNKEVSAIARECGLTRLLTLEEQMVGAGQSSGEMGRFLMVPDVWPIEFRLTVDGAYAWLYYFRQFIRWLKKTMGK